MRCFISFVVCSILVLWNYIITVCGLYQSSVQQYYYFLAANYKAVRCLALTSLNAERSSILLQHFMETGQGRPCGGCFPRATKFVLPFSCLCNYLLNWVPKMKCLDNQQFFVHCTWSKFLPFHVFVAYIFNWYNQRFKVAYHA